jgi:hypothetical protein
MEWLMLWLGDVIVAGQTEDIGDDVCEFLADPITMTEVSAASEITWFGVPYSVTQQLNRVVIVHMHPIVVAALWRRCVAGEPIGPESLGETLCGMPRKSKTSPAGFINIVPLLETADLLVVRHQRDARKFYAFSLSTVLMRPHRPVPEYLLANTNEYCVWLGHDMKVHCWLRIRKDNVLSKLQYCLSTGSVCSTLGLVLMFRETVASVEGVVQALMTAAERGLPVVFRRPGTSVGTVLDVVPLDFDFDGNLQSSAGIGVLSMVLDTKKVAVVFPQKCRFAKCAFCGVTPKKKRVCARCRLEYYCGAQCQRNHWVVHKPLCVLVPVP